MWSGFESRIEEAELFTRRFGSFSKFDYEVLMFTIYLDSLKEEARDYDISIDLGITESKVRSLRIRSQLLYPRDFNWREELAKSISNGYYKKDTREIVITFENPSVQNRIRNEIEKNFLTVGLSLNAKQLVLPVESFLLLAVEAEKDPKKTLKEMNKRLNKVAPDIATIEQKPLKTRFLHALPDLVGVVGSLIPIFQIGKPIVEAIVKLLGGTDE